MQSGRVCYTYVLALNPMEKSRDLNISVTMPRVPVELQTSEDAEHLVKSPSFSPKADSAHNPCSVFLC